jgi:hypothetical protein
MEPPPSQAIMRSKGERGHQGTHQPAGCRRACAAAGPTGTAGAAGLRWRGPRGCIRATGPLPKDLPPLRDWLSSEHRPFFLMRAASKLLLRGPGPLQQAPDLLGGVCPRAAFPAAPADADVLRPRRRRCMVASPMQVRAMHPCTLNWPHGFTKASALGSRLTHRLVRRRWKRRRAARVPGPCFRPSQAPDPGQPHRKPSIKPSDPGEPTSCPRTRQLPTRSGSACTPVVPRGSPALPLMPVALSAAF